MSRAAELARVRASQPISEQDARIWFGVGLATLERVEAGEVLPGPELEHRIDRFLQVVGGGSLPFASAAPRPPLTHGDGPTGGEAAPTGLSALCGAPTQANRGDDFVGAPTQANRGAL